MRAALLKTQKECQAVMGEEDIEDDPVTKEIKAKLQALEPEELKPQPRSILKQAAAHLSRCTGRAEEAKAKLNELMASIEQATEGSRVADQELEKAVKLHEMN